MQVYILNPGVDPAEFDELEARIRANIANLNKLESLEALRVDRLRSDADEEKPYVLYPVPARTDVSFEQLIGMVTQYRDYFFIIFISDEISATHYKRLVQTGGAEWVPAHNAAQEIADVLWRKPASSAAPPAEGRKAAIATFVPSGGGVGNSTLAVESAVQLRTNKATREQRVCLIDLDFQNSHVCDYLDIEPRLQIQELAENPGRLDAQLLGLFVSHHSSGLDVLASPRGNANPLELNVAALDTLFGMISEKYQFILVDLPTAWLGSTPPILSVSGLVLAVGINTIPSLRATRDTLEAVRAVKPLRAQIATVVNRCETRLFGGVARRQHVKSILRDEQVVFIREDANAARESVNTGIPVSLSGRGSRLSKDVARLTTMISALRPIPRESPVGTRSQAA
jgi:Flp pilus assembly CpaE family ATPase